MDYRLDFARYNASGYNVVMYGDEHLVYDERSYRGINTGNFLIRNCQWSLDLLDRWASFGATLELREKNEDLLTDNLSDREHWWVADDQSVLVYLLISEREKWGSRTCMEQSVAMSGYWQQFVEIFRDEFPAKDRPFVTHFAGCKPGLDPVNEVMVRCLKGMDITYNFADNQVLQQYGLRHVHLNSTKLLHRSSLVKETQTVAEDDRKDLHVKGATETESEEEDLERFMYPTMKTSEKDKLKASEKKKVDTSDEEGNNFKLLYFYVKRCLSVW